MGTRSTISILNKDGTVENIYCHWDGYYEHNGAILKTHYKTPEKVKQLISLGSLSVLAENIEPTTTTHSFDSPEKGVCVFYGRDRGEDDTAPRKYWNKEMFYLTYCPEEYNYIYVEVEQKWYHINGEGKHSRMVEFLSDIDDINESADDNVQKSDVKPTNLMDFIEYYKTEADLLTTLGHITEGAITRKIVLELEKVLGFS